MRSPLLAAVAALLVLLTAVAVRPFAAHAYTGSASQFVPVSPTRVLDTRLTHNALSAGETRAFGLPSTAVPATATAVVLNVTVTNGTAPSYLELWPAGDPRPSLASNVNWAPGQTVANLSEIGVGTGAGIQLYNSAGAVDVILDVAGYYVPSGSVTGGQFEPLAPARIADSRSGLGIAHAVAAGAPAQLALGGVGNVPSSGVSAVVLNVTVTNPSRDTYVQVYPAGLSSPPVTSNVNLAAGSTRANRVIVQLDSTNAVKVLNSAGSADVIVDVNGYYTGASVAGGLFTAVTPTRLLDTRTTLGGHDAPLSQWETYSLPVTVPGSPPAVGAAVLNVTATDATAPAYLQVRPDDQDPALTSDVNVLPASQTPNLVVVRVGADGKVAIYNSSGSSTVIVDLLGWFTPAPAPGPVPAAPAAPTASAGDRSATVSWSAPASTGSSIVSYYVSTAGGQPVAVVPGSQTSLNVGGLINTQSYQFVVSATNGAGTGARSAASAIVTPVGTPDPPVNVVATVPGGFDTASVCWSPPANNGGSPLIGYLVVASTGAQVLDPTTCATFGGLNQAIPVTFTVQAINAYGYGPPAVSNPVTPPSSLAHHIVVSLSAQHMWVYQGATLLAESDVTTGRPELPTPPGEYHIFYKTSPYEMISPWPYGSPYWYPDTWVSWVLEFREGGYFLHDAPWRTWFGPGSEYYGDGTHGCVNIPTPTMQWLYSWANVGDWVTIEN